jgi:hypothetical protein
MRDVECPPTRLSWGEEQRRKGEKRGRGAEEKRRKGEKENREVGGEFEIRNSKFEIR